MRDNPNRSLRKLNSFGVESTCSRLVTIESETDAFDLVTSVDFKKEPHFVLGGGTNVLFMGHYDGWIIRNEMKGLEVVTSDDDYAHIKAMAGENWQDLVSFCIEQDLGGIENLSYIPGTVGAAPIQNIGAYGVEIKDVFDSLTAVSIESGKLVKFQKHDCEFGYRNSIFKNELRGKYIITSVVLRLHRKHHPVLNYGDVQEQLAAEYTEPYSLEEISKTIGKIRSSKLPDPKKVGNAGSFFKNAEVSLEDYQQVHADFPSMPSFPASADGRIKIPAGWLIEQAGWKGKCIGNAGVSPNHALVLINLGGATGEDIFALSVAIIESVRDMFGIELEREVTVVGE